MAKLIKATGKIVKGAKRVILTVVKQVKIKVKWPTTDPLRLKKAKGIKKKMTGNPRWVPPYPHDVTSLTDFGTHIQTYDDAQVSLEAKEDGAEEAVRAAEVVVHNDVNSIAGMVQATMKEDPAHAQEIAASANFETAYEASRGPRPAGVYQATEPGGLIIEGDGQGDHEFERSSDGGKTVDKTYTSTSRRVDVTDLESDVKYWFRWRQVLTKGRHSEWSIWISNRPL